MNSKRKKQTYKAKIEQSKEGKKQNKTKKTKNRTESKSEINERKQRMDWFLCLIAYQSSGHKNLRGLSNFWAILLEEQSWYYLNLKLR